MTTERDRTRKTTHRVGRGSWTEYDLELVAQVWHLYSGGVQDSKSISEAVGVRLHANAIKSMVEGLDQLVRGPIQLEQAVRCLGCGAPAVLLPCRRCFPVAEYPQLYRAIDRRRSKKANRVE